MVCEGIEGLPEGTVGGKHDICCSTLLPQDMRGVRSAEGEGGGGDMLAHQRYTNTPCSCTS